MARISTIFTIGVAILACGTVAAQQTAANSYTQTNLASDVAGMALTVDPYLVNPWGTTRNSGARAGGGWYTSDNGTGTVTDISGYEGYGGYYLTVPSAEGAGAGSPAGACIFGQIQTFTTLDGTIQENGEGNATTIVVNNSGAGAVYTACTETRSPSGPPYYDTLYVANSVGGVEAYTWLNNVLSPVSLPPGAFTDPSVPAGYTPYGIQAAAGRIWVTFANGTAGAGQGYVDAFDSNGNLLLRLQHGSWMNQPYGVVQAPASGFGPFSKALLVAMTGSGVIAAFNPSTGTFAGILKDSSGQPIVNPGIHAIGFGNGAYSGGPTTTLYFTAGIDNFTHGLFGSITAN